MKKLFDELKNLMNKYDLYQADDEVGLALNDLETAVNTETRVYVINIEEDSVEDIEVINLTDEEFMDEAERQGKVFTLQGFQNAFNEITEGVGQEVDVIRFLQVPVSH